MSLLNSIVVEKEVKVGSFSGFSFLLIRSGDEFLSE